MWSPAALLGAALLCSTPLAALSPDGASIGEGLRHTELRASTPEADSEVEGPVEEILLAFTTSVQAPLSRITVFGPDGGTLASGPIGHPSEEEQDHLRIALQQPANSGSYRVEWRAMAPDGHLVEGTFEFSVIGAEVDPEEEMPEEMPEVTPPAVQEEPLPPADPEASPPPPTREAEGLPTGTGVRWLQLIASVLLLGAVGVRFGVLPPLGRKGALSEVRSRMRNGLWRYGWVAAVLLLVALPLRLRDQLGLIGDGIGWNEASFLLFQTGWGAGWFLQLFVGVLAVVGLVLAAPRGLDDRGWSVLAVAALLLPLVPALQGHAWGAEEARAFAVPSLYLHVAGAGLWLGGLALLILVGLPALKATPTSSEELGNPPSVTPPLARLVNAFSRLALIAVGIVVVTGSLNSWILVGGPQAVFGTDYGRTLLLKLGLVAVAFTLGFYNWRKVRPRLAKDPDPGALRIPASVEAVFGIVILLVTAILVASPPP